jgi:hypothetical protein
MARRRMLSENILYDPEFNGLSIDAQNIFIRMLIKTDDYGIIPADQWAMLNLPKKIERDLECLINEIQHIGLITLFEYEGKPFIAFKCGRFDDYQSYLISKRTRSEALRLEKEVMESKQFQEILGKSWKFTKILPGYIESRKYKVESKKQKEESKKTFGEYLNVLLTETEYEKFITEHGKEKTEKVIQEFSERKKMKGYKYDSDYLAIRKWKLFDEIDGKKTHKTQLEKSREEIDRREKKYMEEGQ